MIARSNSTRRATFQKPFRKIAVVLSFACVVVLAESARSQETDAPKAAAPGAPAAKGAPKKTSINFEDQLVEGQTQKPELFYLLQQRNNNFKRLIRLRENFLPEMRKTSEDVGRSSQGKGPN